MDSKLFNLVIVAAFIAICIAVPLNTNEEDGKKFVQNSDAKMLATIEENPVYSRHLLRPSEAILTIADVKGEIVRDSLRFDTSQFKDEELKNIFKNIRLMAREGILGRNPFANILEEVFYLDILYVEDNIPKYSNKKLKLRYFPNVHNIIGQSNDTREVEYYWSTFRERNSRDILWRLKYVTDGMIAAAKATNMTPAEFWMKGYNLTEMERLMNETRPLYVQLHAFIRNQLLKKYGDSVIKADGPIPDHLFQQVLAQAWTNGSIIDDMFPHKNLPSYNQILEQKNYNAMDLYKSADEFYRSLGFESAPDDLFESFIKISRNPDEGDCRPIIPNYWTKSFFLSVCQKMDFRTFLQAHGYMGRINYSIQKQNLPSYYLNSYNLEFPVGEAVILSASTLSHLKLKGFLGDAEITDEIQFNRLLRMAIHTLLNIPIHFVHTKTMADFFEGKVELPFLNKHYWRLMDQYAGIEPPNDRLSGTFDFSYKFLIKVNENRQAKKFYSEILGYQIYKRLCQISGKYQNDQLYNCDFYGSKEVGNVLKNMMNLGSSKPFNKVLETIFPDNTTITADSLLEYYSPIKNWLIQKNQVENVKLGWIHSTKVVKRVIMDWDKEYDD